MRTWRQVCHIPGHTVSLADHFELLEHAGQSVVCELDVACGAAQDVVRGQVSVWCHREAVHMRKRICCLACHLKLQPHTHVSTLQ